MIKDRKEKLAERAEGDANDKDKSKDPNEESKDSAHIVELRRKEEELIPRMQTRHS